MQPYQMNPINDFYFRNAQMMPQQGYQPVQFPPPQNQVPQVNSRFVTNIEEAKAAMIDPLSYNLYLDTNSGKIYLKKLGNNGQSEFLSYTIEEQRPAIEDPMREIRARLMNIENIIGGMANDKSISGNAGSQQSPTIPDTAASVKNESDDAAESASVSKDAGNDFWKKRR